MGGCACLARCSLMGLSHGLCWVMTTRLCTRLCTCLWCRALRDEECWRYVAIKHRAHRHAHTCTHTSTHTHTDTHTPRSLTGQSIMKAAQYTHTHSHTHSHTHTSPHTHPPLRSQVLEVARGRRFHRVQAADGRRCQGAGGVLSLPALRDSGALRVTQ